MRQACLLPVCAVYLTLPRPAFVKGFLPLSLFAVLSLCAPSHVNVARDKAMYTAQKPFQGLSLKKEKKKD